MPMEQSPSDGDRAAKRVRLASPHQPHLATDISSMMQTLDITELRSVLAAEASCNHRVLESVSKYFDIARKNASVTSVDEYLRVLGVTPPYRGHYGPIAIGAWDNRWRTAINRMVTMVNHRSLSVTKANAIVALRMIGRAEVRGNDGRLREDDIVRALKIVLGHLTREEKKDLIRGYGSLKALSDFRMDLPHDYNPDWLLGKPLQKWTREGYPYKEILDDTGFLSDSETDERVTHQGEADQREKATVDAAEEREAPDMKTQP